VTGAQLDGCGAHALCNEALQFGLDGAIFSGHDVPTRLRPPSAQRMVCTDLSLTPVHDDEQEMTLDLLTKTSGVRVAFALQDRVEQLTQGPTRVSCGSILLKKSENLLHPIFS